MPILKKQPPFSLRRELTSNRVKKKTEQFTANDAFYFLIVASLPTQAKAEEYIAAHPDSSLKILVSDNRYRIYSASGMTYNEVFSSLSAEDTSAKYPDAWIYRR